MLCLAAVFLVLLSSGLAAAEVSGQSLTGIDASESSASSGTWAVLAGTSRFWLNYRHIANALAVYHTVKRLGVSDDHIILMLADDAACNARNPLRPAVYYHPNHMLDLYGDEPEIDYRGQDVTVHKFLGVLTGKQSPFLPVSKRIFPDAHSNVLVYLTGHGGEDFLKFQDKEELTSQEVAAAFASMHSSRRYRELMFVIDTCQSASMFAQITAPNIFAIGSSKLGESSYSHFSDGELGLAIVDRFTFFLFEFLQLVHLNSSLTVQDLLDDLRPKPTASTLSVRQDLMARAAQAILVTDFFAAAPRAWGSTSNASVRTLAADQTEEGWKSDSDPSPGIAQQPPILVSHAAAKPEQVLPRDLVAGGGHRPESVAKVLEAYAQAAKIRSAPEGHLYEAGNIEVQQAQQSGKALDWRVGPTGALCPEANNSTVSLPMMLVMSAATACALCMYGMPIRLMLILM